MCMGGAGEEGGVVVDHCDTHLTEEETEAQRGERLAKLRLTQTSPRMCLQASDMGTWVPTPPRPCPATSSSVGASRHPAPYLFQPIEHRDEEADVGQSLVVEIPDPLHQLWGGRDCRQKQQEAQVSGAGG